MTDPRTDPLSLSEEEFEQWFVGRGVAGQMLDTRAVVAAILAVAEALRARDALAGSGDE